MNVENGIAASVLKPTCGRDGGNEDAMQTFPQFCRLSTDGPFVRKTEDFPQDPQFSMVERLKRCRDPEAEVRELRPELKRCKNSAKKQGAQCTMEVDEDADNKKKLRKQLRDIEKFTDKEQSLVDEQKE